MPTWLFPSWKHCSMGQRRVAARQSSARGVSSGAFEKAYLTCPSSVRRRNSQTGAALRLGEAGQEGLGELRFGPEAEVLRDPGGLAALRLLGGNPALRQVQPA